MHVGLMGALHGCNTVRRVIIQYACNGKQLKFLRNEISLYLLFRGSSSNDDCSGGNDGDGFTAILAEGDCMATRMQTS